jgi:hypothetical protein
MLERLNGDKKGDAIVSVRGYEPIWTKFTPSYELKNIYFKDGKATMACRESNLFEKENYVFDIAGKTLSGDLDELMKMLEEKEEKDNAEEIAKQKRIAELDQQWQSIVDEINLKIEQFSEMLKGKDAKAIKAAQLGNKVTLLYAIMDEYDKPRAEKIQEMADYIARQLPKLKELQEQATK